MAGKMQDFAPRVAAKGRLLALFQCNRRSLTGDVCNSPLRGMPSAEPAGGACWGLLGSKQGI